MPKLELQLLGAPQWWLDGVPLQRFVTRKAEALLIYLAVNRQIHRRDTLAAIFWPEIGEKHAHNSLRRTFSNLRQLVGSHLIIDRHSIAFATQSAYWLDVEQFTTLLAPLQQATPSLPLPTATIEEALSLYRADFLTGFVVNDAPLFEEWARLQCESYHRLAIQGLSSLAEVYLTQGHYHAGLTATQRLLTLEPWHEAAHRCQMHLLIALGRQRDALAQYELCRTILANELDSAPATATTALYEAIRNGAYANRDVITESEIGQLHNGWAMPNQVRATELSANGAATVAPSFPARTNGSVAARTEQPVRPADQRSAPATPHNLPKQLTPFFGREEELADLVEQLCQRNDQLITLFGEGGVGKSRLALTVGQTLVTKPSTSGADISFSDGIWYVPLAGLQPTADLDEQLAGAIAQIIGCPMHGRGALRTQVLTYLQNKQTLLLLDNFDGLVMGRDFILALLQQCTGVRLLVTSRRLLNLQAEVVWSVTGLPTPPIPNDANGKQTTVDLAAILRYPSIALFVERARRVQRTFQLTADNWHDVVQICHLSEGLPLAIELAAAQVKLRTCAVIRQTLTTEATALSTKYYDIPDRHRSLKTVLNDSWQMLTDSERIVLAATAVFAESFTPEAATAVAGATPTLREDLYDKSMLQRTHGERFHLHPFVQQFAGEQLQQFGDDLAARVSARHGRYYLQLVQTQRPLLHGPTPQPAIRLLQQDLLNIAQAWQWAVTQQEAALLAASCQGLVDFHSGAFFWRQGEQQVTAAIVMMQQQLTALAATDASDPAAQPALAQLEAHLATLLYALAHLLVIQNDHAAALRPAEQAIALAHKQALLPVAARGAYVWGVALTELGDYAQAEEKLDQTLALARKLDMPDLLFSAFLQLGHLAKLRSDYAKAFHFAQQALGLGQAQQMVVAEQHALNLLGIVQQERGDYEQAKAYYEQALPLVEACNLPSRQGDLLGNLGAVYDKLGHYDAAQRHYHAALQIFRQLGLRQPQAQQLGNLGISADYLGDYAAALRYSQECLQIHQSLGMTRALPVVLVNLALHAHHLGDQPLAQHYGQEALDISTKSENRHMQSYAWTVLGHAALGLERSEEAATAYTNAIDLARALALPFMVLEPLAGLVRVNLATNARPALLRSLVDELMALVATHGVDGLEEPFRVYHTCYEGLYKLNDPRAAAILQTAYGQLLTRALQIEDEALQHSFLTYVAANRALVQAATADQRL